MRSEDEGKRKVRGFSRKEEEEEDVGREDGEREEG